MWCSGSGEQDHFYHPSFRIPSSWDRLFRILVRQTFKKPKEAHDGQYRGKGEPMDCPDFHFESGDGGVKEYPAPDLSLLQKETSKRTSHLRYVFSPESKSPLCRGYLGWCRPRSTYFNLVMNRFDGLGPVLDGERALRLYSHTIRWRGAPPFAAQKRLVRLLITLRE